jgi:hypothetical protein
MLKSNVHNLNDYAEALHITEEFPRILAILDSLEPALQKHSAFTGVSHVLQAVYDAKVLMRRQLKHYQQVKANKGRLIE